MNNVEYYLLGVFTDTSFSGNQLAVFTDSEALDTRTMQALANELNLAETVFLGAATELNHYPMRIFTPTQELPFAGHPIVGTAQLLAELGLVDRQQTLVLQPPVGELAIHYEQGRATFTTAQSATLADSTLDHASAATLLGLQSHQVIGTPVISSCGLPFHLIQLSDLTALQNIQISEAVWASAVAPSSAEQVYLYVIEKPDNSETVLRSRMFSREHGLCEDPATGSAAAALTGYLASLQPGALQCTIHQGIEMGRPSVIYTAANGLIKPGWVTVSGNAIVIGRGVLTVHQ